MHSKLDETWQQLLASRGNAVALIDAESGRSWCFVEIEARAQQWLTQHASLRTRAGEVWCLALSDRVEWLVVFLAAIKTGAVVFPLDPERTSVLHEQARAQGADYLIQDAAVSQLNYAESEKKCGRAETSSDGQGRECLLIKLTSGTTGEAKALPFSESEMMADASQILRSMSITAEDRNYALIPLGHSYGLGNLVLPFFMQGVSMVLGSSPYPQVIAEELTQFSCSVLPLVPPLVKALALVSLEGEALSHLRLVISAGSVLKPQIARDFYRNTGLRVHNFYGSSETGGICFDRSGELAEVEGAVGTALEGVHLTVDKNQTLQVRSAAVCHARYSKGQCEVHDHGRLDAAEVLHLLGRPEDLVKIAGRRVSLSEIEAAVCALTDISDAYASSRAGRSGELRCVVLYVGQVETDVVRKQLLAKLPAWKVPKILRKVDQIVYTERGKKDRKTMESVVAAAIAK